MEAKDLIEKFEVLDYIYRNGCGNRQIISYIYNAMGKEKFESMVRFMNSEESDNLSEEYYYKEILKRFKTQKGK